MDRRVFAGLLGLSLVGSVEEASAQGPPSRDPSGQPGVGMVPLRSIGDSINDVSTPSGVVPMASSNVPTSPLGSGPAAVVPNPPISPNPVGMYPIESIHQSINRGGNPSSWISSMFRKPVIRPTSAPRFMPAPQPSPSPDSKNGSGTLPPLPQPEAPSRVPTARPSPYAEQAPGMPRPQSGMGQSRPPVFGAGRAAPYAEQIPSNARPQADAEGRPSTPRPQADAEARPSEPRPQAEPSNPPAFLPPSASTPAGSSDGVVQTSLEQVTPAAVEPAPAVLPPPPTLEPVPMPAVAPGPPPLEVDPLAGIEPNPTNSLPPTEPVASTPQPTVDDPKAEPVIKDETALKVAPVKAKPLNYASLRAAAVGDEIITMNELETVVNELFQQRFGNDPGMLHELSPEEKQERKIIQNRLAAEALPNLINQALVLQEARKKLSNPKAKQMFDEFVEKKWKEEEVPPMLRKSNSANVYELKLKLAEMGKSYDTMKEGFRKGMMEREFLMMAIRNKCTCDLSEVRAYYNEHLKDFEQPARMTWRDIEISFAKYPTRAAARKKADDILARLLHDEDFGAVAKATSDGPTASKGGLYEDMRPGSFGIPIVNDELNRIPIGQVSQILEAPGYFHIIRVDSRREKGPLRFDEVQDQIRNRVFNRNYQLAVENYIAELRAKTLVRTIFDKPETTPNPGTKDSAVRAASGSK